MAMLASFSHIAAQAKADIKFDKTTHDFGTMPVDTGAVACTFTFTNVGDAPLVIHQAWASCGCTVPEYTQEPVLPGKTGTINVTYKGNGLSGYFQEARSDHTHRNSWCSMGRAPSPTPPLKGSHRDATEREDSSLSRSSRVF